MTYISNKLGLYAFLHIGQLAQYARNSAYQSSVWSEQTFLNFVVIQFHTFPCESENQTKVWNRQRYRYESISISVCLCIRTCMSLSICLSTCLPVCFALSLRIREMNFHSLTHAPLASSAKEL